MNKEKQQKDNSYIKNLIYSLLSNFLFVIKVAHVRYDNNISFSVKYLQNLLIITSFANNF